jgi:hypothetical protein
MLRVAASEMMLRKLTSSFGEMITDTAQNKHAAAAARRHPDSLAEKPADVAKQCLTQIAREIGTDGFVPKSGGRRLTRRDGDFSYTIFFQLDRNNIAGRRVAVWTHASIESHILKQWLSQQGTAWGRAAPSSGVFAGGQIGNLRRPSSWMEWDFADPAQREDTMEDLVLAIREIIFPFFAASSEPISALRSALEAEPAALVRTVEFAQAHFGKDEAERVVSHFLAKWPGMRESFFSAAEVYRRDGVPMGMRGGASDLAAIVVFLGLDLNGRC